MARLQKADLSLNSRLDEFDKRVFLLKISYEKYFAGIDPIEPIRDRDELRRILRELLAIPVTNGRQRFRLQQLRARWSTLELYWARNLYEIERGTHRKQRYRADQKEKRRAEAEIEARLRAEAAAEARAEAAENDPSAEGAEAPPAESRPRPRPPAQQRPEPGEDGGYRAVFDAYVAARSRCGQSTEIDYAVVRDTLKKQVETLKARTSCSTVKFKVVVEEGKAKVKAVPVK